jgi:Cd2+/Zn2+-exporting ATPase
LKPLTALRIEGNAQKEVAVESLRQGDTVLVEGGERIPADGVVILGSAFVNEAPVTGESVPVEKVVGDRVLSSTLNESGALKIKVTDVGKDSTIERMAALIREAASHKSRSEKLADRFAAIFLPLVIVFGAATYILTRNLTMTAALFLVACADDMAVAIPLALTASFGRAAKRGVIIKGGAHLESMKNIRTLVIDKTGTLTYGKFEFQGVLFQSGVSEADFWLSAGVAEKFSEHPVGRAIFRHALERVREIPDPDEFRLYKGSGVWARFGKNEIAIGDESILSDLQISGAPAASKLLEEERSKYAGTSVLVLMNKKLAGVISVADIPREEAKQSIEKLRELGVTDIIMFTGDNEKIASAIAGKLGITNYRASMTPEQKLLELEKLTLKGPVAMVGDGINDAPAIKRADIGIAMGKGGTSVAIEAADIVILSDDLSRLPELISLSRATNSVVLGDMAIWFFSNIVGFGLVLTGVAGPALAAFYNFATDFLPLINSARLFRKK